MNETELIQALMGKTIYVVSDLHLGDKTEKDNFMDFEERFSDFFKNKIEKNPNAILVLNGDIFEFWQSQHGTIVKKYLPLLKRLIKHKSIFVVGNHDIDLAGFVDTKIKNEFLDLLANDIFLPTQQGKIIHICHGHQFDIFNTPEKSAFGGKIISLIMGEVEMKTGNKINGVAVETVARRVFEPIFRKIMIWILKFYNKFFNKTQGDKEAMTTKEVLKAYHALYPDNILICGHTHIPGQYWDYYVNEGCWFKPDYAYYVKITPSSNITLHKWPSNAIIKDQMFDDYKG